jgi:hypothetical protein
MKVSHGGARIGAGKKKRPRKCDEYRDLGPPPTDTLERIEWAHNLNALGLYHVVLDEEIDERTRREEVRQISRVLAALIPSERLRQAERLIQRDAKLVEKSEGPETVKANAGTKRQKVIRATPRRRKG